MAVGVLAHAADFQARVEEEGVRRGSRVGTGRSEDRGWFCWERTDRVVCYAMKETASDEDESDQRAPPGGDHAEQHWEGRATRDAEVGRAAR